MLPKRWTKRTCPPRNVFLASLVLIGAIAAYNWTVAPHRNYLLAARKYELAADKLEKKSHIIRKNVTNKKRQLKELRERFRQIRTTLFEPAEGEEFLSNIQTVSEKANCIVSSLKFSPTGLASGAVHSKTNNYVTARRAMLSVLGKYKSIVALTNELQDRPEKVHLSSIEISSDRENPGYLRCDTTITIYIMHEKEEHQHD